MSRTFKRPEGMSENAIEFIRASKLAEQLEAGEISEGAAIAEGTFLEALPNPMNADKLDFKLETEDGKTIIINGAGNLGYGMKFVNPGDYIQVQYNGKQEIQKGNYKGRSAHNFTVLTAEE